VFVKDGFSLSAMLFAPFWMALNGLWLVLAVYLVVATALTLPLALIGVQTHWIAVLMFALHAVIGYEASSLRRWTLERRGWRFISSVAGRTAAECERRFFEAWLPGEPLLDQRQMRAPAASMSQAGTLRSARPAHPWWRLGSKESI
jgi:hypothetical protein